MEFIKKHPEWFTILGLCTVFYFIFFHGIGTYPLMDKDETRYVSMARDMYRTKDFLTLYLNGNYFFEKPPLYFWIECFSFGLFGKVNEFTARFPVSMCGTLCSFLVYFTGKKIVSRSFGVVSALILATSLEFVILSKFAILDIVVSTLIAFSVYSGIMTYFCIEQNKKYFWWLFYIFSGLAVMAKGIPGFVVPFGTMFFIAIATKRFKELFKPVYMLPGATLFLLIVLPWHLIMFKIHDPLFFNEYIIKHHLHRFINSQDLGRKEPFYFFILVFLWGFIPWIFSAIAVTYAKLKNFKVECIKHFSWENFDNAHKFLFMNAIVFSFIMLFFSSSSTKLITYFLAIYVPAAFLLGWVWDKYINSAKCKRAINVSVYVWGGICLAASIIAIFTQFYLPEKIYAVVEPVKWFTIVLIFAVGIASILFAKKDKRAAVFASNVMFMLVLSAFGTSQFFKLDYKFGQNDLMEFAEYAKANNHKLMSYGFGEKYSLIYYYEGYVMFNNSDEKRFSNILKNNNTVIIVRNKNIDEYAEKNKFYIVKKGKRYSLIKG